MQTTKQEVIAKLQADILHLQGFKPGVTSRDNSGLNFMKASFPNSVFPVGCIHEFITTDMESKSASGAFIAGLVNGMTDNKSAILWVSTSRRIFPPALKSFSLDPERIIFVDVKKHKDILWVMEEGLKCTKLSAVIGEVNHINFTESRRLQLAVEQSKVTGFVLQQASNPGTTACVSRWCIEQIPSVVFDDLPGVSYPKWNVKLVRMRNGRPGEWNIEFKNGKFIPEQESATHNQYNQRQKIG